MAHVDSSKMTVHDVESKFMSVSEFQKALNLGTYQYARQIIVTGRYNLETTTIFDRTYVSRESVQKAIEIRAHNKDKNE